MISGMTFLICPENVPFLGETRDSIHFPAPGGPNNINFFILAFLINNLNL
jgi:hypothetical protein